MFCHRPISRVQRGKQTKCLGDHISSEMIEKKRLAMKRQFYSIQRPITLDETKMILQPMFKDVDLEISVIKNKVCVVINNVLNNRPDTETSLAVLDLVNEWNVHDELRRFLIKSLTSANKNDIFRYDKDMVWKCQLSIEYVFNIFDNESDDANEENDGTDFPIAYVNKGTIMLP